MMVELSGFHHAGFPAFLGAVTADTRWMPLL